MCISILEKQRLFYGREKKINRNVFGGLREYLDVK